MTGRRPRSQSKEGTSVSDKVTDDAAASAKASEDAALAAAQEQEEQRIQENIPREVFNLGYRLDQQQADAHASFTAIQGEISKLTEFMAKGFASIES